MSITVQPTAMTYHGIASESDLRSIRNHGTALDQDGRLTYHHGVGVTARMSYLQVSGSYFRNSVNKNAGAIMAGPKLDFFKKAFTLGLIAGFHFRDPMKNRKLPGSFKTSALEIAPMMMVSASAAIRIYKSLYFEVMAASNYALSFFTPGIRVDI